MNNDDNVVVKEWKSVKFLKLAAVLGSTAAMMGLAAVLSPNILGGLVVAGLAASASSTIKEIFEENKNNVCAKEDALKVDPSNLGGKIKKMADGLDKERNALRIS